MQHNVTYYNSSVPKYIAMMPPIPVKIKSMQQSAQKNSISRNNGDLAGKHVLVVEDDFFVGLGITQLLESMEATVAGPATDLAEAEQILAQSKFDLVLLDVNLEGETTLDLAVKLSSQGQAVAFVTAYTLADGIFSARHAGIPKLAKPLNPNMLLKVYKEIG